jgi:transcriptional regulator with XRE-family HTH domain
MFAKNLKYLRQKYNMEQLDLSQQLGRKSSSSISEWEKGKYTPKANILSDISEIFHVSLSDLMTTDLSLSTNYAISSNHIIKQDSIKVMESLDYQITKPYEKQFNEWNKDKQLERPVIILKRVNYHSAIIIPLTSTIRENDDRFVNYEIDGIKKSANISQIRMIDTKRFRRKAKIKLPIDNFREIKSRLKKYL